MSKSLMFEGPKRIGGKEGYACPFVDNNQKGHPVIVFDRTDPALPCMGLTGEVDKRGMISQLNPTNCLQQRKYGLCELGVKASPAELLAARNLG